MCTGSSASNWRGRIVVSKPRPQVRVAVGSDGKLLKTGIVGSVIAALCCFTPLLVVLLGAVGLFAVLGWIDYALLPALAFFIALTLFAVGRRQRHQGNT